MFIVQPVILEPAIFRRRGGGYKNNLVEVIIFGLIIMDDEECKIEYFCELKLKSERRREKELTD